MNKEIGIYIHIPFCRRKCFYCDFVSFENEDKQEKYIEALIKEIEYWKEKNKDKKIKTIYIGGGTPSFINSKDIIKIIKKLEPTEECKEITIEVNPGTVNKEKLLDYKNVGINRVSIGLQSTKNELLHEIGRIHNFDEFMKTYHLVKEVGFKNVNVDLMIGLPNQTLKDVEDSLKEIVKLNVNHVSVYSLIIEEGTKLYTKINNGELKLPEEELERKMYWKVKRYLESKGYKHYEISNFAKEGYESKHNFDCWNQKEYKGFGLAAHSYINDIRFSNICDLNSYIENIEKGNFEKNIVIEERKQTKEEKQKEYMLLGLRKIDGIKITDFENKFNVSINIFKNEIEKLLDEKLIVKNNECIKLSNKGIDLANMVWEEFI